MAHLEVFRRVFVEQRRWFSAGQYADLVALCQFFPGPASSQTGIAIGLLRAGYPGAFCAWLGFTLPSALLLAAFAWLLLSNDGQWLSGLGQGLAVATVAVVGSGLSWHGPDLSTRLAATRRGTGLRFVAVMGRALGLAIALFAAGGLDWLGLAIGAAHTIPANTSTRLAAG